MNAVYCFKQLIGTAISIKSSNKILYPSITICTKKSDSPLDYPPELNETLIGAYYRGPDGTWQEVSLSFSDVENRTKTYAHYALWNIEDDFEVRVEVGCHFKHQ